MAGPIDQFAGRWRPLSNFYPSPFSHDGITYMTNEHFFNAHKTLDLDERRRIAAAATAAQAKQLGRAVTLRPGWDETVRYEVMELGLALKFQDPWLHHLLLDTGAAELVEGNTWHDLHWGVCVCWRHQGQGQNHLGKMLMALRDRLRQVPGGAVYHEQPTEE